MSGGICPGGNVRMLRRWTPLGFFWPSDLLRIRLFTSRYPFTVLTKNFLFIPSKAIVRYSCLLSSHPQSWDFTRWCYPSVCLSVCSCRLCRVAAGTKTCPICFLLCEKFSPCEIYGCGGGLIVASVNAPQLLATVRHDSDNVIWNVDIWRVL